MFRKLTIIFFVLAGSTATYSNGYESVGNMTTYSVEGNSITFSCSGGEKVKISILTEELFRVRLAPHGLFQPSVMIRWGFVRDDWPEAEFTTSETGDAVWIKTDEIKIEVRKHPLRISIYDKEDHLLVNETDSMGMSHGEGTCLYMDFQPDEHFYGFGFQRKALDAKGEKLAWTRRFRWEEATVPFFMSTRGYGFYSNNTWMHTFDFTQKKQTGAVSKGAISDYYSVSMTGGQLDYYFIYGPSFRDILDRYTDLTGKPLLVPRWALGLEYICRYYESQDNVVRIAGEFRKKDIPCDIIGLEPGWEEVTYSMDWKWSTERFPDPAEMIERIGKNGFKMKLWESGEAPVTGYTDPEVRKEWYKPRFSSVLDIGVKFFKQDDPYPRMIHKIPEKIRDDNKPGPSGAMSADELNNITNTLYSETVFNEYRDYTGERAMVMFNAYNASVSSQRWPFQWAGDFGSGYGLLNASLSGHAMVSYDMNNRDPSGIHQGFLVPYSLIDSWCFYQEPWNYSETIEEMNRFYSKLRYSLLPYLYTTMHQSNQLGLPMMRPMILEYQNDDNTYNISSQFMLGDWLLVGLSDTIYLPAGKWIDYWTGKEYESDGEWEKCSWPETSGGALFVKGGAIVPMSPVTGYIDEELLEVVTLNIYPHKESNYTLYEDDGISYDYEKGSFSVTEFSCKESSENLELNIGERIGSYSGMPENRTYLLSVHYPAKPSEVLKGTKTLIQYTAKEDLLYSGETNGWYYDEVNRIIWLKPMAGWYYGYDKRGEAGDIDRDMVYWDEPGIHYEGDSDLIIKLASAPRIVCSSNSESIPADGISTTIIQAKITDPHTGEFSKLSDATVSFTVSGPASFPGGTKTYSVKILDGIATVELSAGKEAGKVRITAGGKGMTGDEIEVMQYGKPGKINVTVNIPKLLADGISESTITATVTDKMNYRVHNSDVPVTFEVTGEGFLPGRTRKYTVNSIDGMAETVFTSTIIPGTVTVKAKNEGLDAGETTITTLKGTLHVKAFPPEEVNLPSSWTWRPESIVTIYATIKGEGETMTYADNPVRLHVAGPEGKSLLDREVKAINGIAEFKDIRYERPARYIFHLSGEGIEPAQIKIFE